MQIEGLVQTAPRKVRLGEYHSINDTFNYGDTVITRLLGTLCQAI